MYFMALGHNQYPNSMVKILKGNINNISNKKNNLSIYWQDIVDAIDPYITK